MAESRRRARRRRRPPAHPRGEEGRGPRPRQGRPPGRAGRRRRSSTDLPRGRRLHPRSRPPSQGRPEGVRLRILAGGCSGLEYKLDLLDAGRGRRARRPRGASRNGVTMLMDLKSAIHVTGSVIDYEHGPAAPRLPDQQPERHLDLLLRGLLRGLKVRQAVAAGRLSPPGRPPRMRAIRLRRGRARLRASLDGDYRRDEGGAASPARRDPLPAACAGTWCAPRQRRRRMPRSCWCTASAARRGWWRDVTPALARRPPGHRSPTCPGSSWRRAARRSGSPRAPRS